MLTDYRTDDTCATVHAKYPYTTARTTRVLLYTYATQRLIGTRAPSLHVGMTAHVYTVPTAGSPTYARIGRYATVPAGAGCTWAHPPTCAPYTAVRFLSSARAPVVILQEFLYVIFVNADDTDIW